MMKRKENAFKALWNKDLFSKTKITFVFLLIFQFLGLLIVFLISIDNPAGAVPILLLIQSTVFLLTIALLISIILYRLVIEKRQKK